MNGNLTLALESHKNKKLKYIYLYSKSLNKDIRSLRAQATLTTKELNELDEKYTRYFDQRPYTESISFFIEPIPTDIIGKLFGKGHRNWHDGNVLYEYCVDVDYLEKDILYSVVETPTAVEFMDMHYDPNMTGKEFIEYARDKNQVLIKQGYVGEGVDNLVKAASKFLGTTRDYFIKARKRADADKTKMLYAASVPHLMLYPKGGIIRYSNDRRVVIGK